MTALYIVGAGGFGREVYVLVKALGELPWTLGGFIDDAATPETEGLVERLGSSIAGTVSDLEEARDPFAVVVAIGNPRVRRGIVQRLTGSHVEFPTLVHPDATIGVDVLLGAGTIVCAGARLSTHIAVGEHVHIDQNATIGHDTVLGDFSRLNPQACVSGSVQIEEDVLVGASATVLQGLNVGAGATLGAGCVAVRPVPPGATVMGVPAR